MWRARAEGSVTETESEALLLGRKGTEKIQRGLFFRLSQTGAMRRLRGK